MSRLRTPRWTALAVVIAILAVSGVAVGLTRASDDGGTAATTTSTTATTAPATTSTTVQVTTTAVPVVTTLIPPPDDGVLERGERGEAVAALQRRLAELRFDPGPADGAFGVGTLYAVQGFQKLAGLAPDGRVGAEVQQALASPPSPASMVPDGEPTRVEVDKQRQLLFLYVDGGLRLITHVSTGSGERYCVDGRCGTAITPEGAFRFMWRYDGWRKSRLGKLYNPVYFTKSGVAIHGSTSVPTYPASHGCVRIPMHIAEYFPSLVQRGHAVYVLGSAGSAAGAPPPQSSPEGPPPEDPPTSPDSTTTTTAPQETTTSTTTTTAPGGATTTSVPVP